MPDSHLPPPDTQGEASETFQEITITGLTASRLVQTDANQQLDSVANLASWVAGAAGELSVADDGDGTITVSLASTITTAHTWSAAQTFTASTVHSAHATVGTNNAYDLGASGTAWRSIYWATQALGGDGTYSNPSYSTANDTDQGFVQVSTVNRGWDFVIGGGGVVRLGEASQAASGVVVSSAAHIGWNSGVITQAQGTLTPDVLLFRGGPAILELRNATTAQTFRVYGTTTGPRYGALVHNGTNTEIQNVGGGTIYLRNGGTIRWGIDPTSFSWFPNGGNTYDLGDSTNTVRSINFGTQALGPDGTASAPPYSFSGATNWGMARSNSFGLLFSVAGTSYAAVASDGLTTTQLAITSAIGSAASVVLVQEGTAILAQRNGATAQVARWYGTFTDASNYERFQIVTQAGATLLQQTQAGTGVARGLSLETAVATNLAFRNGPSAEMWRFDGSTYSLFASTDNSYDIGASGATRPRTGYFGTSVVSVLYTAPAANDLTLRAPSGQVCALDIAGTAKLSVGASTVTFADAVNMVFNATTGTKIGTATTQKLGFFNATPVVQPTGIANADGTLADITTKFNTLLNTIIEPLGLSSTV